MSYIICYSEFVPQLLSEDERTVKEELQRIFELLTNGKRIARSARKHFTNIVEKHVTSKSIKVRKWAYHCACFYQNEAVINAIKNNLKVEKDKETIIWALTALSKIYDDVKKLKECVGKRHEEFCTTISQNYLTDALYLLGGVVKINPKTILLTNNSADLAALTKIYAYNELAKDKYPEITDSIIREIAKNDDSYAREYAFWAQVLRGTRGNYLKSPIDPNDDVRKWQIAAQIKEADEDFVVSVLRPLAMCPEKISYNVKAGIMRGINEIPYSEKYVASISSWFTIEEEESILLKILDYAIINCSQNCKEDTFYELIKDALNDISLSQYIVSKIEQNPRYGLVIKKKKGKYILDLVRGEERTMPNVLVYGSRNQIALGGDNSAVGTGNSTVAANHSTITSSGTVENELSELINSIRKLVPTDVDESEHNKVEEGLNYVEIEAIKEKPNKAMIQIILDGLRVVKGTAQFAAAVTSLINFFK